jgi:hypothetical protein
MKRTKILYILGQFSYPLRVGHLVHSVDLLKFMSKHYDCYVIGFSANSNSDISAEERKIIFEIPELKYLKIYKKNSGFKLFIFKVFNLIKLKPLGFSNWDSSNFIININILLKNNDFGLIHLNWFPAVGQYLNLFKNHKTILTLPDSQSLLLQNEYSLNNLSYFRKFCLYVAAKLYFNSEKILYKNATIVHTVSKNDKAFIDKRIRSENVVYIPTHIPFDCKIPINDSAVSIKKDLILLRPNGFGVDWFFGDTCNVIKRMNPRITLTVIAQALPAHVLHQIECDAQIVYKSWVDSLWDEILSHNVVLLTDMNGAGLPTRTMCAMSLGVPIVGTPYSFRGMDVINGKTCLISSVEYEYASMAVKLNSDKSLRKSIAINAKNFSDAYFGYDHIMSSTKQLYIDLITDNRRD